MAFWWAIGASVVVSLISLVGIFTFLFNDKLLNKLLILLIGFSAGGLIGGAFLHLLPEALEHDGSINTYIYLILGFIMFFVLERYFLWRHCHNGICDVHPFSYLNLIGDGIHNFFDGLIIGSSFLVDIKFGVITTATIVFHEIPQEIGDFGVLVYGGFGKYKALFFNLLSALTAIVGAVIGFYFGENIANFSSIMLPFAAGGFIYIASCDLIPEIHKQSDIKKSSLSMLFFILGILFIYIIKQINGH